MVFLGSKHCFFCLHDLHGSFHSNVRNIQRTKKRIPEVSKVMVSIGSWFVCFKSLQTFIQL
jgi:hypothetical protein